MRRARAETRRRTVRHALGWALIVLLFYLCVDAGVEGYKSVRRALLDRS